MIRFEDVLAARLLYQQLPDLRGAFLRSFDRLQTDTAQRGLLSLLVEERSITREQASWVFNRVEAHKREHLVSIYGHLLVSEGKVDSKALAATHAQLGPEVEANTLGDVVLARRLIAPELERQLRYRARLAFDRDMANQLTTMLESLGIKAPERPKTQVTPLASPDSRPFSRAGFAGVGNSGVIKGPLPAKASQLEIAQIVKGTLSDADDELPGPAFRIPSRVDMSDARTGKMLEGYRFLGRIGAGAMGTVYLCDRQDDPKRPFAIKLLPKNAGDDARGRFKREILANGFISHPGALDVFDAGETDEGYTYLVMEYFEGFDLEHVLEETTRLPPRKALTLSRKVFETLGAAHENGVIHRDVKPANILVDDDYSSTKLMDFGIAIISELDKFKANVFHTMEGAVTGTPEYMCPEQASGERPGPPGDIYSMGVVLYHLLSGRLPFTSETTGGFITCHMIEDPLPITKAESSLKSQPKELAAFVHSLLEKDPSKRPTLPSILSTIDELLPRVSDRAGSGRFFDFLGWRKS